MWADTVSVVHGQHEEGLKTLSGQSTDDVVLEGKGDGVPGKYICG